MAVATAAGRVRADQSDGQRVGAAASDEAVEQELAAHAAGPDADQKEWPVQRVPGRYLQVGQKREASEQVGRPERQMSGADGVREVALRAVVHVDAVELDRAAR